MGCGGIGFLVMLCFERGYYANEWPIVMCAMVGNFFISTTFAILWLYTPELFPTSIRLGSVLKKITLAKKNNPRVIRQNW